MGTRSIQTSEQAYEAMMRAVDRYKMSRLTFLEELIFWFDGQPEMVQRAVIGQLPSDLPMDVAKMLLERFVSGRAEAEAARQHHADAAKAAESPVKRRHNRGNSGAAG